MTEYQQEVLEMPLSIQLDSMRGVVDSTVHRVNIAPETRINIVTLAGRLGIAMDEHLPSRVYEDVPLDIYTDDFKRAELPTLQKGLIIEPNSPLYKDAKNQRVVTMGYLPLTIYGEEGVQLPNIGVALGVGEYAKIVVSPRQLAARARAATLDARDTNNIREETKEAGLRGSGHVLEKKLEGLDRLETKFLGQRALLLSLQKDARIVWRTAYLGKNLDRRRG